LYSATFCATLSPKIKIFRGPQFRGFERKAGAKVLLFFDMTKFFRKKMQKTCVIGTFFVLLLSELA
jgi:hypothetical protein